MVDLEVLMLVLIPEIVILGGVLWYWVKTRRLKNRLVQERSELAAMLSLLLEVTDPAYNPPAAKLLCEKVVNGIARVFPYICSAVVEVNHERQSLTPVAWKNMPKEWNDLKAQGGSGISRSGRSLEGKAIVTRQMAFINDALADPQFKGFSGEFALSANMRAGSAAPIMDRGKVIGTLVTYSTRANIYNMELLQFFQTIANFLGVWIKNRSFLR